MAHHWHFPRQRHMLMQGIMCVLLGGTVALAALLDHNLQRSRVVVLSEPIVVGPFSFRLPVDRSIQRKLGPDSVSFTWSKPDDDQSQTMLTITVQDAVRGIFPTEYLRRQIGPGREIIGESGQAVDGHPGELGQWRGVRFIGGQIAESQGIAWTVILPDPDDVALTVRLERAGPPDASDYRLLNQILDAVKISSPD